MAANPARPSIAASSDNSDHPASTSSAGERPADSAVCSSTPRLQHCSRDPARHACPAQAASTASDDDASGAYMDDDGCMSDADSGDSDLTARITGLEVRLARRSAEVEMLKAAVLARSANCQPGPNPSPPVTPQPPQPPAPRSLSSPDGAGHFGWSPDGQAVALSGPYAGRLLSQVALQDPAYLHSYLWAPQPMQQPQQHQCSQLLAALALRNCAPLRCR